MAARTAREAHQPAAPAEFDAFYGTHFQRLAVQLHAYLGDAEEAQDLTQEAFCRALDRWDRIHRYEDPAAWVRRVAWNLATSALRRRTTALRYLSRHRDEPVPGPQPDRVALARALSVLPPRQRRAVVLHHVAQLSTAEIAEQEGVAEGTVRSWLTRGRTALATQLSDDDQGFRPAPVSQVQEAVRRRRRARRVAATVGIVAVFAVPTLAYALTRGAPPPDIGHEPTPTVPTPQPTVTRSSVPEMETRHITVPGFPASTDWSVRFTDAEHAWAFTWEPFALAATDDGGLTWRAVDVPLPEPGNWGVNVYPLDGQTITLNILVPMDEGPDSFLLTTDGGATWSTHPQDAPPIQAQQAYALERGSPGWMLECDGQTGFLDGAAAPECETARLTKLGSGPVDPQPVVGGNPNDPSFLNVGGDGRLWIYNWRGQERGIPKLQVSSDGAKTWQTLPTPDGEISQLLLSPDGADAWLFTQDEIFRFVDGQWRPQSVDMAGRRSWEVTALDGGILLIPAGTRIDVYQNGATTPLPASPPAAALHRLPDGTLVGATADRYYLGTGEGLQRTWVQIVRSGR